MWRTRIARSVAIAMVASALTGGACSSGTAPAGELSAARSRWERSAPASYTVTIARSCECLPEMTGPVVVTVRNGVVDSRQYVRSGATVTTSYVSLFPGVDGLFAIILTVVAVVATLVPARRAAAVSPMAALVD